METHEELNSQVDVFADHSTETKIRTKKMLMWLIILAIVMLFAGITSAVMVLYGKLLWVKIIPPTTFWIGNTVVILSSVAMMFAVRSLKAGRQSVSKIWLVITLGLGILFVYFQNDAWRQMTGLGFGRTETQTEKGTQSRWNTLGELKGEYGKDYAFEMNGQTLSKEGETFVYTKADGSKEDKTLEVKTTFNAAGAMLSILIYLHIAHLLLGIIYLIVNTVRIHKNILNQQNWMSLHANGMYWHFMGLLWLYLFLFIFFIY
ncbi:MAG: heme-copper oxidase subunit III [Bacteroidota bacterium]